MNVSAVSRCCERGGAENGESNKSLTQDIVAKGPPTVGTCPAPRKWLKTGATTLAIELTHLTAACVSMAPTRNQIVASCSGDAPQKTGLLRGRATCLLTALVCLNLAACALSGTEIEAITRTEAPPPALVQTIVTNEFRAAKLTGNPQISDLHETTGPQPGDWMLCFRSDGADQAVRYAVFFRNDREVITRPAATIDGCHKADYHPLQPPLPHWPGG